jgi:hypothetical protein
MSEHEFRWLVQSLDLSEEMYIPIEAALKAIIVGAELSNVNIPSVRVLCEELSVPVFRVDWVDGKPRVDSIITSRQ